MYALLLTAGRHTADLDQYAQLFLKHNITGKSLMLLSQDDLKAMGITSVGHRIDLHVCIQHCYNLPDAN